MNNKLFLFLIIIFCKSSILNSFDIFDTNNIVIKKNFSNKIISKVGDFERENIFQVIPKVNDKKLFLKVFSAMKELDVLLIDFQYIDNSKVLFESLFELNKQNIITSLDIINANDSIFPNHICNFTNLSQLFIDNCINIKELPSSIRKLQQLNTIRIHAPNIVELPDGLFDLKELHEISLFLPKLKYIPKEIENLINLKTFSISMSEIEKFPIEMTSLKQLYSITISYNPKINLSNCFKIFSKISSLKVLEIYGCKIDTIPDDIILMNSIKELSLFDNNLKSINKNLFELEQLKSLTIDDNPFTELDNDICKLKNLYSLSLDGSKITNLPNCINNMNKLSSINLYRSNISKETIIELRKKMPDKSFIFKE